MKAFSLILVGAAIVLAGELLLVGWPLLRAGVRPLAWWGISRSVDVRSEGPTVQELERLLQIVPLRVRITDVVTAEGGGYEGAWLVKGDALIVVDVHDVQVAVEPSPEKSAPEGGQRVVLRLPTPTVSSPRVDHEKTRKWDIKRRTWVSWVWGDPQRLSDEAMRAAQRAIEQAASSEEFLAEARDRVESTLRASCAMLGWEVAVEWKPGQ